MNRRSFLISALGAAVGSAVLPRVPLSLTEPVPSALWQTTDVRFSTMRVMSLSEINDVLFDAMIPAIQAQFDRELSFYSTLQRNCEQSIYANGTGFRIPMYFRSDE